MLKFAEVIYLFVVFSITKKVKISLIFLDSSAVEHSAVNRRVVGSNPTRGVTYGLLYNTYFDL